uniref:Uncharacterized protein n=1 Tax=Physcomitrium patens TaxID=3218 RepID=A0A2K1JUX6_PHYPA|nr:hypothetical protein PHYPA_015099 [Physcomitrium patens]
MSGIVGSNFWSKELECPLRVQGWCGGASFEQETQMKSNVLLPNKVPSLMFQIYQLRRLSHEVKGPFVVSLIQQRADSTDARAMSISVSKDASSISSIEFGV